MFDFPYLTNFQLSRPETAFSVLTYNNEPEKNLYRHPDRQGPPNSKFNKVHDIYALRVVLLEIRLWEAANTLCDYRKTDASQYQRKFLIHAERRLEHHIGPSYTKAVVSCLSGEIKEHLRDDFLIVF